MGIVIEPYTEDLVPAVEAFNQRLAEAQAPAECRLPDGTGCQALQSSKPGVVDQKAFLAVENGLVRGGYTLKHQALVVHGELRPCAIFKWPLSEGIVDTTYAGVAIHMLRHALRAQPFLFALGMGGHDQPLPRILELTGWMRLSIPFYCKIRNPGSVLRNVTLFRKYKRVRFLAELAATTGAGWVAIHLAQKIRTRLPPLNVSIRSDMVESFSSWADRLWAKCKNEYALIAPRDSRSLNERYPKLSEKYLRILVKQDATVLGWAIVLDTQMSGHKHFGNLRVGTIADCLASPEDASTVVRLATEFLERRGVDLIVSNQAHPSWCRALQDAGFLKGPSNFDFAASPSLAALLSSPEAIRTQLYLNRGDGDGPIHL